MTLKRSKTQPDTGADRQLDGLMQLNTTLMNGTIDACQSWMRVRREAR